MKRWTPMLRRLVPFAVFGTLGLIVAIALAWIPCMYSASTPVEERWCGDADAFFGASESRWQLWISGTSIVRSPQFPPSAWDVGLLRSQMDQLRWSAAEVSLDPLSPVGHRDFWLITESGYPLRSFRGWKVTRNGVTSEERGQAEVGLWIQSFNPVLRAVPYIPLPTGLLLNTAFYGGILWLLWFGPGMIRRGVRRRRGLCVRCGYDFRGAARGAACPECGGEP